MEKASVWKIFCVFAKIGAFTIGGGYVMIPLIEKEITDRGWLQDAEIKDMIVLAQSAPGLLAVNMAVYTGYKLGKIKGSIAATVGAVLPSFLIILLVAIFFNDIKDNAIVRKVFQGMRPVAIALILVPAVNMAKTGCKNWWTCLIAVATLFAVAFLKVSPVWIILTIIAGASGISYLIRKGR